jgi:two-component system, chemotaxis family, protein-glutamate methylesterase/glutaminase
MPMREQVDRQIRVIVIDDSAFMRKCLSQMLESDPRISVVATARNGVDGIEKIKAHKPDVATLDIEMPLMDGLTALQVIMRQTPLPVIMVSSLTTHGAEATLEALDLGAIDFISKDIVHSSSSMERIRNELIEKIYAIVSSVPIRSRFHRSYEADVQQASVSKQIVLTAHRSASERSGSPFRALVIGVSTGGPQALHEMLPKLPTTFPLGIVIAQHMPPRFTQSMADRLNSLSNLTVKEAQTGDTVEKGKVLIAPGGLQTTLEQHGGAISINVSEGPSDTLYRPSVDLLMTSAAEVYRDAMIGLIMTGMGKDGLLGLRNVRHHGGYIMAQDEASCVVYGMPKSVIEDGIADTILSLDQIPGALTNLASRAPLLSSVAYH